MTVDPRSPSGHDGRGAPQEPVMPDGPSRCERCGEALPESRALGGACPRCVLELALGPPISDSESGVAWTMGRPEAGADPFRAIARYRVLSVIGEGGMGTVYEAEQDHPRRTVALKIIKPGLSNPKLLRRFEQESQALGRLQHPGIAQIYEAGTADAGLGPQPYFAMELIRGRALEARGLSANERLEMVARIAEAVHHAHQRGVIHRDLKPGNIIVDETGQPKILDFGIARAIDSDTRATSQTDVGQLMGTLAYMSPEQTLADPLEIDTRTDVYALGVILYELLAGRLPNATAKMLPDTVRAIREEEPIRLGLVNRQYRGDIETIVATALEKDKARRYGSAADLAADIRRYLSDQPIVARPPTAAYQLMKFARRNRALVASAAAVFVVLVLAVVVSLWFATVADRARDAAMAAKTEATALRDAAIEAERRATRDRDRALTSAIEARHALDRAGREQERANATEAQLRQDRDRILWQNLARESIRLAEMRADDDVAALLARQAFLFSRRTPNLLRSTVLESALQQASSAMPWNHSLPPTGTEADVRVRVAVFSPDGRWLATNGPDGSTEIWDLKSPGTTPRVLEGAPGLGPASFLAFSPDGTLVATGGFRFQTSGARGGARGSRSAASFTVTIWDLRAASPSAVLLRGHAREVWDGAFSPNGTHLVTTDGPTLLLWDMRNLASPAKVLQQQQQPGSPTPTFAVAFSPDGSRLATADSDGVRLWDMRNPIRPTNVLPGSQRGLRVAFSPDGMRLALAGMDEVRLWDVQNPGAPRVLFQGPLVQVVAFSLDSARLAAGTDDVVRIWELGNPAAAPVILRGHRGVVSSVEFSPDGSRLVSGGNDRTVRIWELQRAGAPLLLSASAAPQMLSTQWAVTFSTDGRRVYSASPDGAVRMWDPRSAGAAPALLLGARMPAPTSGRGSSAGPSDRVVALSADGTRIALAARFVDTRVWDVRSPAGQPFQLPDSGAARAGRESTAQVNAMSFSPDGSALALTRPVANTIALWDLQNLSVRSLLIRTPSEDPAPLTLVAYSADGSRLVTGNVLEARVWELRKPDAPPVVIPHPPQQRVVSAIALSRDKHRLAVGTEDVRVWDLRNPAGPPLLLRGFPSQAFSGLAFSPDGELLAGGNYNETTQLWDLRNPTTPPVSLPGPVASIAFAPDGQHLVVGGNDGSVRLWSLGAAAAEYLCTRVWRNLSMGEWRLYVGDGIPYERTCPGLPPGVGAPGARP